MSKISDWLSSIGLEQYINAFEKNDIDLSLLSSLTEQDMQELGFKSIGHRKKLSAAIASIDAANHSGQTLEIQNPVIAERRQLTVMFVDLVGSTSLSQQYDPEDLGLIIWKFRQSCSNIIKRYSGHISQYLGDGILVYYGYPQAHENDVESALRAGLEMIEAMDVLEASIGIPLQIRIGVTTGLVVVGEKIGDESPSERTILGETPNLAARLQAFAAPNTLVVSDITRQLAGAAFTFKDCGAQELKGFIHPVSIWEVESVRAVGSYEESGKSTDLGELTGRHKERVLLQDCWSRALHHENQIVIVSGEAGIGKSRLIKDLRQSVNDDGHRVLSFYSSSFHQHSAFFPIISVLERSIPIASGDSSEEKLKKLEKFLLQFDHVTGDTPQLLAALLSIPIDDRYPVIALTPQRQKDNTLEILSQLMINLALHQSLLLVFEDLHWSDPSTLQLIERVIQLSESQPIMVLATKRPEFVATWESIPMVREVKLERLDRQTVKDIIMRLTNNKPVPPQILEHIISRTDGIPLFVEELTKSLLESKLLIEQSDRYISGATLQQAGIPNTLQDSLMARLDRLAPFKEIAQLGAILGRSFKFEVLAAVSSLAEYTLKSGLAQFEHAELITCRGIAPDTICTFKHALVQEAAYKSVLRSNRQRWHASIAKVLEQQFAATVANTPEVLAYHFQGAVLHEQAIHYWSAAGRRAIQQSANLEAIGHLHKGLEAVDALADSPEKRHSELELLIELGGALTATAGYAASVTGEIYERANKLSQQLTDAPEVFPAVYGQWNFLLVRGETRRALGLAEKFQSLAQHQEDNFQGFAAHCMLGQNLAMLGEFDDALVHLEQSSVFYSSQRDDDMTDLYGEDPGVTSNSFKAWMLWQLGHPEQASLCSLLAVKRARERQHVNSTALALTFDSILQVLLRRPEQALVTADKVIALSTEQHLPYWQAEATIVRGWALLDQGDEKNGIQQMENGLLAWKATGATEHFVPGHSTLLASGYLKTGQISKGLTLVSEALDIIGRTDERWYEAELHRLQGELLLNSGGKPVDIKSALYKSFEVAKQQNAKSSQLRAASSIARFLISQREVTAARDILQPVYSWFSEGYELPDLKDAKAILEQLDLISLDK